MIRLACPPRQLQPNNQSHRKPVVWGKEGLQVARPFGNRGLGCMHLSAVYSIAFKVSIRSFPDRLCRPQQQSFCSALLYTFCLLAMKLNVRCFWRACFVLDRHCRPRQYLSNSSLFWIGSAVLVPMLLTAACFGSALPSLFTIV